MSKEPYSKFELSDFTLVSGEVLPNAFIAYKTYGDLRSPVLIYPTWYGGGKTNFDCQSYEDHVVLTDSESYCRQFQCCLTGKCGFRP